MNLSTTTNQPNSEKNSPIALLDLSQSAACGLHTLKPSDLQRKAPEPMAKIKLQLPAFSDASYYATYQDFDPLGQTGGKYPTGANRMQAVHLQSLNKVTDGGVLLLLQLLDGKHMAILPIVYPDAGEGLSTTTWLSTDDEQLTLNVCNLGQPKVLPQCDQTQIPVLSWAICDNVYEACRQVWDTALKHPLVGQSTRAREEKQYPEILTHLGWCSWEQYKFDISEDVLTKAMNGIEASGLPIRYVLVDDGHLNHENRRLLDFEIDKAKFPNGWKPILDRRTSDGVTWIGLWLCFNGYWAGLSTQGDWDYLSDHLEQIDDNTLMPKQGFINAMAFYDQMIQKPRQAGFDFVKVDDQAQSPKFYKQTTQGIASSIDNAQALEAACARHMDGLINCMAHSNICAFNTRVSNVTRCSEDYKVNDAWRGKAHLHNSFANMLWLGATVWGDHDMFHSNDQLAGYTMAVSKAVSGGPVYLSDDPTDFDPSNVLPLCDAQGKLYRPIAPATALPDSIYINPFKDEVVYRTIAPLEHDSVALALFNLTEPTIPVKGKISPEDYTHGSALIRDQDAWELPEEGVACYDWQTKKLFKLNGDHAVSLPAFECQLFLVSPIKFGIALIGDVRKYLSPATITQALITPDQLLIELHEAASITVYSEKSLQSTGKVNVIAVSEHHYELSSKLENACVIDLRLD
ncbi:MAG: Sip1-related alpha-galactosidase [Phycisphaeraceae bacterium JB051]